MLKLKAKIESMLGAEVSDISPVGGGYTAKAFLLELKSGEKLFCKTAPSHPQMFFQEALGLKEIAKAGCLRTPEVVGVNEELLLMEYIASGEPKRNTMFSFGQRLAGMHRCQRECYGFDADNFIGTVAQKNTPMTKKPWNEFFLEYRLLPQWQLAEKNYSLPGETKRGFSALCNKIASILPPTQNFPASLLHGDLWAGNYLVDQKGEACLMDPAVYYGDRETDLALCRLFGGYSRDFFLGYEQEWPLESGWKERERIYHLYHLLNHLNMMGESYLPQVQSTLLYYAY